MIMKNKCYIFLLNILLCLSIVTTKDLEGCYLYASFSSIVAFLMVVFKKGGLKKTMNILLIVSLAVMIFAFIGLYLLEKC